MTTAKKGTGWFSTRLSLPVGRARVENQPVPFFALVVVVLLMLPGLAFAQVVPERELDIVKSLFDAGNYQEALKRARDAMAATNFSEPQRLELHRIAGLSAFNSGDQESAKGHFLQLLQLNPDSVLDPFAAPPPAVKAFEQVRKENTDSLNLIRQQLALRAQQEKRSAEDRERERIEADAQRRKLEELGRTTTVRSIEKRSFLMNFVPFGVGQFQQDRIGWGIGFAVLEAVTALTSIISYFSIEGLFTEADGITLRNVITSDGTGTFTVRVRHIPASAAGQAAVWRTLKLTSGIAFYALWALGIGDAIWHHEGEVVTERRETLKATTTKTSAGLSAPRLHFYPVRGGAGAGFSITF